MGSFVSHVLERALGLSAWLSSPSTTSSTLWRSFLATTVCQRPSQKPSPSGVCSAVILPAPLSTWNNSCQRKQFQCVREFINFFFKEQTCVWCWVCTSPCQVKMTEYYWMLCTLPLTISIPSPSLAWLLIATITPLVLLVRNSNAMDTSRPTL